MKSFWKDNPYFKFSLYAIFVAVVTILFYRVSSNTDNIAPSIIAFFKGIINVLLPILYGFLIAYLFNPIMIFFETYFLRWFKPTTERATRAIRSLSILLVYLSIIGTLVLMVRYLIPQIGQNLKDLLTVAPTYIESLSARIQEMEASVNNNISMLPYTLDTSQIFDMINPENILNMDFMNNIISSIMNSTKNISSYLYNIVMGLVIAFYMLLQKEDFATGIKRILYSTLKRERAEKIINISTEGNDIFIQFFVGKFIDSVIIGIIAFIGVSIMKNPYALLIAFIIGIFNMIPYFGPFLGAIPAIIITLFTGFMPAVFLALFIFILQQFDGLVLGPKILGDSIGLSPLWIISGVIVGGALWGPLGMFFSSPIIAVVLNNINRYLDRQLQKKNISDALVAATPAHKARPVKINSPIKLKSNRKDSSSFK